MDLLPALLIGIGSGVAVGVILALIFRRLDVDEIAKDYKACAGHWHESYIHGCSTGLHHIPQQPINTYTNMAYLAGYVTVALDLGTPTGYAFLTAGAYHAVGSALYHALSTRWAGSLDVSGMYAVFSALTAFALCALVGWTGWAAGGVVLGVAAACAYLLRYKYRGDMQLKIGVFILLTYGLTLWHMGRIGRWDQHHLLKISFGLFLIAFFVWNLDKAKTFPLKGIGHGIWHLLTATAIAVLWYGIQYA